MQDTIDQAQAAANAKQVNMYVFRAVGLNGHIVSYFNARGVPASPKDELHIVVKPE